MTDHDGMYTVYSPSGMRKAKWSDLTKEAQQALHEASTNAPKAD
jgi:TRAP-type C4-dicarboxylate transport system substrate-binding protein